MAGNLIGSFVKYLGAVYLVVDMPTIDLVQIINPTLEGSNSNKRVRVSKVTPTSHKAVMVCHDYTLYLVTPKNSIVSLVTNKVVWKSACKTRTAILDFAKSELRKVSFNADWYEHHKEAYAACIALDTKSEGMGYRVPRAKWGFTAPTKRAQDDHDFGCIEMTHNEMQYCIGYE